MYAVALHRVCLKPILHTRYKYKPMLYRYDFHVRD